MKKMNNKGFSLVELIVVVLIMAIIAIALAPQVMKWVENSRKSTDAQTYDSMCADLELALTNKAAYQENIAINEAGAVVVTIGAAGTGTRFTGGTSTQLQSALSNINNSWAEAYSRTGTAMTIKVYGGQVYRQSGLLTEDDLDQ